MNNISRSESEIIQEWHSDNMMVSVVCNTYNHEKFIGEAIQSFLMQETSFPFEILIHDDASTDNTANIIRGYESKYPRLVKAVYQKENQYSKGVKPTTEIQIPRSKGQFIAMCEGDDYWISPQKLQKQVEFLESNKDYSLCSTYSIDDIEFQGDEKDLKFLEYTQDDFILGKKFQTRTCTVLYRKPNYNFQDVYGKYNAVSSGDTFFKILLTKNGNKAAVLPFVGAYYRRHSGGIWSSLSTVNLLRKKVNNNSVFVKYCLDTKNYYLASVLAYRVIRDQIKLIILKLIKK